MLSEGLKVEKCADKVFYTMKISVRDYFPYKAKSSFTLEIVLNMRQEEILE